MMNPQLDYFRELVRRELIPRVVVLNGDATEVVCAMCRQATPVEDLPRDERGEISKIRARHTTYCKLKSASEVCE